MSNIIIIGAQWGDEGKGKIVDWLSEKADIIVRFQGGHNAGHTIVIDDKIFKLHLLPAGIVRKDKICIIGNGVVINPYALFGEIAQLQQQHISISPENLVIAENTPLILPFHQTIDLFQERQEAKKIGTTGRGIGPAYQDKVGRRAIRVCDLTSKEVLREKIENLVEYYSSFRNINILDNIEILLDDLMQVAEKLLPFSKPIWKVLYQYHRENKKILFEGAQGTMLDIDHGTYPFVTSSNTVAAQAFIGCGFGAGLNQKNNVLGVTKAYTTRVGGGPFPTELHDEVGELISQKGQEFGTTTGRKRRCGWFDAVLTRQAARINGISALAITKLDILDNFDTIKICVGYKYNDIFYDYFPSSTEIQSKIVPIYEELPGWQETVFSKRSLAELPKNALNFIKRIEELVGVKIAIISTSPKRDDTILVDNFDNLMI